MINLDVVLAIPSNARTDKLETIRGYYCLVSRAGNEPSRS